MSKTNKSEGIVMTVKAQKWGNSIGLRIPQKLARKYGVMNGTEIEFIENGDMIQLKPINNVPTLDQLLDQCQPENKHDVIDFGHKGREWL